MSMSTNMAAGSEKQYGLIQVKTLKKLTVSEAFKNDSDSDNEQGSDWVKKSLQREAAKGLKKQTKLQMQRALEEDPTVYQYDEVYDNIANKKEEAIVSKKKVEKKPKYIQALLQTAERRKKENERRLEREIQKEREEEGDTYKDKEEFITSSYKQKLEEFKKAEEEERKMEYIESVMDVSKQQDLGGFYRHLYKETIPAGETVDQKPTDEQKRAEQVVAETNTSKEEIDQKVARNYRKRSNSEVGEGEKSKHESSSCSSSSSSSSDSSSSDSSDEETKEKKDPGKLTSSPKEELSENKEANNTEPAKVEKPADKEEKVEKPADKEEKVEKPAEEKIEKPTEKVARPPEQKNDEKSESRSRRRDSRDRGRYYRESDKDRRASSRDRRYRDDRSRNYRDSRDRRDRDRIGSRRHRSRTPDRKKDGVRQRSRDRSSEKARSKKAENNHVKKDTSTKEVEKKETNSVEARNGDVVSTPIAEPVKEAEAPKICIWEKRTVGHVFDAALERYFQRKAARGF